MRLKAKILKIEVKKNPGYNTQTGNPHPSYFLEARVMDLETYEVYRCSFRDTYSGQLRQAYLENWPEADRDALARKIEADAKQARENQQMILEVENIRGDEDSLTLIVRPIEQDQAQ